MVGVNAEVISGRIHGGEGRRKSLIVRGFILVGCVYQVASSGQSAVGMPKVKSSCGWGDCWEAEGGGGSGGFGQSGEPSGARSMALVHPEGASGGEHRPVKGHGQRQKLRRRKKKMWSREHFIC